MPDLPDDSRAIVAKRGEELPSIKPTETLTLKRGVGQVVVRQSFSHGRSKTVLVEKVRRRSVLGNPDVQGKKAGKKAKGARKSKKNIRANSPKSKPIGKPFSVNELLLGEDDGSPSKRRKKRTASGGGASLNYRTPSAGLPGNEHADPNPAGRRGSWPGAR